MKSVFFALFAFLTFHNCDIPKTTLSATEKDYDTKEWTEVKDLAPDVVIDIRYATKNNFVGDQIYDCARCFLRPEVAKAIAKAQAKLKKQGLGFKIFDGYRPRPYQQRLWDKKPDDRFVTPPAKGSMHNRGAAVDITLVDTNGKELDMGTSYDFFGEEAYSTYTNLPAQVLKNRQLLRETLEKVGLKGIRTEWWHFSYSKKSYELSSWLWKCK
ncbi:MAG: hypothetical protein RLZZ292_3289 [Bacteroidota bacterium]|jgi:D-alanyl-D-alanine dipeptidase